MSGPAQGLPGSSAVPEPGGGISFMSRFLLGAVTKFKASALVIFAILLAGVISRASMTVESSPSIKVPVVVVSVSHAGISPEDGMRLLMRPVEQQMKSVEGVKEVRSTAREGAAYAVIEFGGGADLDKALLDTREAVNRARAEFPANTDEPQVDEIRTESTLLIVVSFASETADQRQVYELAREFQERIEDLPQVLEVRLKGSSAEVAEILVDPERMEAFGLQVGTIANAVRQNNLLIPAGELDAGRGNFGVKVPSLIEGLDDIRELPVLASPERVVRLSQVADVRRTFKDPSSFSRVNGRQAIALEVYRRTDANTAEASEAVQRIVDERRERIPADVDLAYSYNTAEFALEMVDELSGNIIFALALVMILVIATLGLRPGILIGIGIPFSLLGAAIVVYLIGYSFNFMVMFGLLLSLGMLIDGTVVVVEYANRRIHDGERPMDAYMSAVRRMAVPIIASTATTLAAFAPLLFWPGVVGDYMGYLPTTVFAVLIWSLVFSLLCVPVIARLLYGEGEAATPGDARHDASFSWIQGRYLGLLERALERPGRSCLVVLGILVFIFYAYGQWGRGMVFFNDDSEDIFTTISIRAQGNLQLDEKIDIVRKVEARLSQIPEIKRFYISNGGFATGGSSSKDSIAGVLVELQRTEDRELSSSESLTKISELTRGIPGVIVQVNKIESGPPSGKDVQVQVASHDRTLLHDVARRIRLQMEQSMEGLTDIEDSLSLPGIDWRFSVDSADAAMLGVSVAEVGQIVQMVTGGVYLGEYRPDDAIEEVEVRLRFPEDSRSIEQLRSLRVSTPSGAIPLSSFVSIEPQPRVAVIRRHDSVEYVDVSASAAPGVLANDKIDELSAWIDAQRFPSAASISFKGAREEQDEAGAFLMTAFVMALLLMLVILVVQFNSFYQAMLIISAIIMSTAGVMLGLLITQRAFSTIMTGTGLVALAGIVVNNNIVLIDTFNIHRRTDPHLSVAQVALLAARLRFRPVLMTTLTTVVGLLPLALGVSVDLVGRNISVGGQVGTFWVDMASAIVNGLMFATVLTLVVTPVMLVLPDYRKRRRAEKRRRAAAAPEPMPGA